MANAPNGPIGLFRDGGGSPILKPTTNAPGAPEPVTQEMPEMLTNFEFLASWLRARVNGDRGAALVEYALLVALIAVVCIAAIKILGEKSNSAFTSVGQSIGNAVGN
jgi:pilus assembly protein Flp/PilA